MSSRWQIVPDTFDLVDGTINSQLKINQSHRSPSVCHVYFYPRTTKKSVDHLKTVFEFESANVFVPLPQTYVVGVENALDPITVGLHTCRLKRLDRRGQRSTARNSHLCSFPTYPSYSFFKCAASDSD